jgi:hypothetical protein
MKTWLLKNKQTNAWKSSKATADACYALLLQGNNWTKEEPQIKISLGSHHLELPKTEQGTGYFKITIPADSIESSMANITVQTNGTSHQPAWGAVYWQYFDDIDKISPSTTTLNIQKKLFTEKNTDRGPVLVPLEKHNILHVGDKVKVRIEIRTDRLLEYVHMKDLRAAALEPLNVLSSYKWQGGLGYYESTGDASTNFFFNVLPKGTYVFEYALTVSHTGIFSNGPATIECMYAPEFSSHTEGIQLNVTKNEGN